MEFYQDIYYLNVMGGYLKKLNIGKQKGREQKERGYRIYIDYI